MMIKQLTTALAICMLSSGVASAATLTVNVKGISVQQGHLMVAVFEGQSAYDSGKTSQGSRVKVANGEEVVVFENLIEGDYAIKLYHDENDNNKLDTNMFGIPNEGYGFSNNSGRFGAPEYQKASFSIKEDTTITIDMM